MCSLILMIRKSIKIKINELHDKEARKRAPEQNLEKVQRWKQYRSEVTSWKIKEQ